MQVNSLHWICKGNTNKQWKRCRIQIDADEAFVQILGETFGNYKKNHKLFGLEMNVVDYISFLFNFLLFKLTGIFGFFHLASNLETARVTYTTIPAPNVSIIWFSKKWYGFFMKNSLELQLAIIYFATMLQIHYLINIKLFGANITLFNSFQQSIQAITKWLINIYKSALTNETALFLR